jgi:hypothetical protein
VSQPAPSLPAATPPAIPTAATTAAGGRPDVEASSHPLLAWYAGLLGGIVPVLLLGFLYSALADRLVFVGWALVLTALYTAALRQGLQAGWPAPRLIGALALLMAAGALVFSRLEALHHEVLDLGFRAVLPAVYTPAATSSRAAAITAGTLAGAGLAILAAGLVYPGKPRPRREA